MSSRARVDRKEAPPAIFLGRRGRLSAHEPAPTPIGDPDDDDWEDGEEDEEDDEEDEDPMQVLEPISQLGCAAR